MSEDLAAKSRWRFEDFEHAYDTKFGRLNGASKNHLSDYGCGTSMGSLFEMARPESNRYGFADKSSRAREKAPYEKYIQGAAALASSSGDFRAKPGARKNWQKPLPEFGSPEMLELAQNITREIVDGDLDVQWDSIKGLESAKRLLKEAVVMPIKYPQYFTGLLAPWKGILLFGPPGTGKTMLAKAVATECKTTFFNISASSIVSKWRGDSEKLVKVLFQLARHFAPSTIFLDEIDALVSTRGEGASEHEASRRLKTELLVQLDGLSTTSNELVFVLAATNLPWQLDGAMLRRLEKRILVPLPEPEAREAMFRTLLGEREGDELPWAAMVDSTKGFSGSDVRIVCKEAAMRPLRRILADLDMQRADSDCPLPQLDPITPEDVMVALKSTRPTVHLQAARYAEFNNDLGSQILW
ncbi:hypothetical protein M758_11G082800 [Ceratodon purpureus]|nr:hypothetical protein M758_11G082800 [Ceratodon purpureus]